MTAQRGHLLLAILLIGAAGCTVGRQHTFDREAVRRALPNNVTLDLLVRPTLERDETVEKELIRLGAYVDDRGILRDSAGKEIRFHGESRPQGVCMPDTPLTDEQLRKQEEWKKYCEDFRVIWITWNQFFEPNPC